MTETNITKKARTIALEIYHNAVDSDDESHSMDVPVATTMIADALESLQRENDSLREKATLHSADAKTSWAECDELRGLVDRLKLEAQTHAMEARTANSTIAEIYQIISGARGEPVNWNGAEPVRKYVAAAEAEVKRLRDRYECWMPVTETPPVGMHPDALLHFYCISDKVDGEESPEYWMTDTWQDKPADAVFWCAIVSPIGPHERIFVARQALASTGGEHHAE